ncbi:MAG: Cytochrome oxidase biogenesis protein Cox11-CtaG, copper delivery to Cox1 [uncultured Acetobacteraceae bacterium]|jgi:cytochrome c oxidase assembly protein subunit 11|uniref:Cytochrome c oxidase assembly protein CtaG n=1 Tax=uncultured Acetobacteraceae bacterium TaxID=169975 RepID=A0A6J4J703_9PROT|nr:MAG: Cytochrome oxidase biogenesis protein Cox11-CtaG, copper delivery to Cox1 [uncultured Acetobacteraceae bacterium]
MDDTAASRETLLRRRNRRLGFGVAGFVAGMVGLAFASVPLYQIFCRVTGYNGTVQTAGLAAPGAGEQVLNIRFNATTHPTLPWRFAPAQGTMRLPVGEEGVAFYRARNLSDAPVTGVATYNVTPEVVGKYFHKTACFCFERQTLEAGQEMDMPLSFWVDPRIGQDPNTRGIRTVTVSYSFFRTLDDAERAGAVATAGPHVGAGGGPARGTP